MNKIHLGEKCTTLFSSGGFRFMLVKFRFWTAIYLLLELPSYKYYLNLNFLSSYNRVTDINVAAEPTAKCSTKFQRNLTAKYSKTAGVSKNKLGGGGGIKPQNQKRLLYIISTSHFTELYSEFLLKCWVFTPFVSSLQNCNPYTPIAKYFSVFLFQLCAVYFPFSRIQKNRKKIQMLA